jgi:hypothetical protein
MAEEPPRCCSRRTTRAIDTACRSRRAHVKAHLVQRSSLMLICSSQQGASVSTIRLDMTIVFGSCCAYHSDESRRLPSTAILDFLMCRRASLGMALLKGRRWKHVTIRGT